MTPTPRVRCIELVERVTEWMEGALTAHERHGIEEHLVTCARCVDHVDRIRLAIEVTRRAPSHPAPTTVRATLLDAFRSAPR